MLYRKILVPMALDHDISAKTLEVARALCAGDGDILALHVTDIPVGGARAYLDPAQVKDSFAAAQTLMAEKTSVIEGVTGEVVQGHTYRTILDYAKDHGVDCIVIGSHRPGLSDFFLGSTAARVVRHAPCAVHVYRS